ncbi:MAG: hypothetical protein H6557_25560 [Lewinellaceae bacterium]|nr:hypothetical protein [Phaeodactylibacter sp.]MCB9040003.1 hypothetical protein [Lewinellaceae bacterium]
MSDKRKDPQASLATLQKEVETLLDKAEETRQQLGATRRQILDAQLQASHEMLEHIEAINQFRQEIREMLVQLEGFDPDDLEAIRSMGEQLATAPLFHPQFEELLARKANAANNGRSFDEQLREQVLDRLDEFSFFPGEKENTAHNAAVKNLIHADKLAKTWELPTLSRLLLSQDPAARLDAEAALSLFSKLKEGLQEYLTRIRREDKSLRNSTFGRHAFSTEPDEGLDDFQGLRELLEKMRDAFADSIQRKGPSPLLESLIEEYGLDEDDEEEYEDELLSAFLDDMLDESEGLMFSEDFGPDIEPFFDEDDDEEWMEVENPRFPVGSSVRVTADKGLSPGFSDINIKGWQGRVEDALTNGQEVVYIVALDSPTLQELPERFIEYTCEEEYGSFSRYEFDEEDLEPAAPRDTEEEAFTTQRQLFHRFFWGDIQDDEQAARMYRIMLASPASEDIDNWIAYFHNEVEYPFPAVVEGLALQHIEPGTEIEVLGVEGIDEEEGFGLVASIKKGRAILSYPLMELMPVNEHDPKGQPLLDYRYWADLML